MSFMRPVLRSGAFFAAKLAAGEALICPECRMVGDLGDGQPAMTVVPAGIFCRLVHSKAFRQAGKQAVKWIS
ncbi:hypothetical protein Q9Q94_11690 [Uliginosibacterium sp. 31-16]|uniref:hypothetical protein n=1 Tax=Uliginosibacterium sp. 31-16 TaxID=3068315 RepID=UPI00273E516A|nr:hypothetical protein [Uliginosibacterium sp. 31-16]MDP5240195.1 hypothetical protein [Uliginosibacterium sp. 31-16]